MKPRRIDGWFLFDALLVFIAFVDQFIQLLSAGTGAEQQVPTLRVSYQIGEYIIDVIYI